MNPDLFDLSTMEAAFDGLAVGLGLALFIAALVGFVKREPDPDSLAATFERALRGSTQRLAISGLVGILVALLTGWPVAGIAVCALIFFWGKLFGGMASERLAMQRVEALAMWTESLRDTIAGAVGLEQAIPASARAASPVLRPHLNTLIDRLRARMPLPDALQYLADDIDDASADLVISALMLNAKLRGPGLRDVLGSLAKSAREEVDMRQRVMAQRAGTRRSVQIIVIVVCVVVLGVAFLAGSFVKPYDTLAGQMVLCMVIALFGAGFWWMRRLAEVEPPPRLLVRRSPGEQRAAEGMAPGPQTMSPWSMPPSRAGATFPADASPAASSAASSRASSSGASSVSSPVPPNGASLRPTSNSLFTPTRTTSGSLYTPSPLSTPLSTPPLPKTPLSTPPLSTPPLSSTSSTTPPASPVSNSPLSTPPLSTSPLSTSSMSASQSSTPPQPRSPFAAPPQPRPPEPMPPHPSPQQQMPAQQAQSSSLLPQWKSPPQPTTPSSSTPALSPPTPTPPVPAPQVLDPTVPLPRIRLPLASGPSGSSSLAPPRSTATAPAPSAQASTPTDPLDTSQSSTQQPPATQQSSTPDLSDEPPSTPPGDTP